MEGTSQKPDRKTIERNRRLRMKGLISKLVSLVPSEHFKPAKELLSQYDQLDQSTTYITELRERVEDLNKRKQEAMPSSSGSDTNVQNPSETETPIVEVKEIGSSLEVVIISGKKKKFALHEIVRILNEEGAEVLSASISTVGLHIYHILHAKAKVSRLGIDADTVSSRLEVLVSELASK